MAQEDTSHAICSLGPERSPGAEQNLGVENQGWGLVKGAEGGLTEGNKPLPDSGVGRQKVLEQRDPGLNLYNLLLCDPGQVASPL